MVTVTQQKAGQKSRGATPVVHIPRPDNRRRQMLRFFLDTDKQDELELLAEVTALKLERQFAPTIRDGLRLMRDLRAGRFDCLFDLFDWIPVWIESEVERRINERMTTTDSRLARLEAEIAALKATPPAGPRPLAAPTIAAPVDDDNDADLIVISKAKSDGKSAENFLKSAFSLIQ